MRQHAIDLMPASIRARSQAGARTSRFAALAITILLVTVAVATHSRLRLASAQEMQLATNTQAAAVFAIDATAADLRQSLDQVQTFTNLYEKIALPIRVSAVLATVINALPDSITLDQIDVDAGNRTPARTARSKGDAKNETTQRMLTCEISGFAASDDHIAQLVSVLETTPPFRNVNLDFSRTKKVNDRDAREFRLSFKIDLNAAYVVAYAEHNSTPAGARKEVADAN